MAEAVEIIEDDPIEVRRAKREALIAAGIDPYGHSVKRSHTVGELNEKYAHLEDGESTEDAGLLVRQAVELLRQRAQRLAHQLEGIHRHGQLPALRAHHGAMHGNPVAHVQIAQRRESFLAQRVDAAEQLNVAAGLAQLHKRDLALVATSS